MGVGDTSAADGQGSGNKVSLDPVALAKISRLLYLRTALAHLTCPLLPSHFGLLIEVEGSFSWATVGWARQLDGRVGIFMLGLHRGGIEL